VRRHSRIVAPDLLQPHLPRHRPLAGAVEIAQDQGLLLGEADLVALGIEKELELGRKVYGPMVKIASSLASCWRTQHA
jgi:hypothetical protein